MFHRVKNSSTQNVLAILVRLTASPGHVLIAKTIWINQMTRQSVENSNCPGCSIDVGKLDQGLQCDRCNVWFHCDCVGVSKAEYEVLADSKDDWFCVGCKAIRANNIKWGSMIGEDTVRSVIKGIYDEVTSWNKNLFLLPRGKAGSEFIKELTRLINLFVNDTKWKNLALTLVHIFIPLMLQKPAQKSKAKQHVAYLLQRLELWKSGHLVLLMNEVRVIQKRLKTDHKVKKESNAKAFCRLMMVGKVGQALKFIDNNSNIKGVHMLTRNVKATLATKHPKGIPAPVDVKLDIKAQAAEPVVFESITAECVEKVAKQINGSGGPTRIDADGWRHILCSKSYGKCS